MDKQRAAVFIDRDGIILEDTDILEHPDHIRICPDKIDALRILGRRYLLFVFSRPDLGGKRITPREVACINIALDKRLRNSGVDILEWYVFARAREDQSGCFGSNFSFVNQTADNYRFNLKCSFIISAHPHDFPTSETMGIFCLFLLTGRGIIHLGELPEDLLVFHSLENAVSWIENHPAPKDDIERQIRHASEIIKAGRLVAFPTETVYGLGADAFDAHACARIFEVKRRPLHNPLIVHIADVAQLEQLVDEVSPAALRLINRYWPGPLSLVFRKKSAVPDIVTAGHPTVAVRMPHHPMASELIRQSGTPIAAPSANAFGRTSATSAQHVLDQLQNVCDALIDGGACRVGVESTIVSVTGEKPVLLRPGAIPVEELEATAETVFIRGTILADVNNPQSPGMMAAHYQTATPLQIVDDYRSFTGHADIGVLLFGKSGETFSGPTRNLSPSNDVKEAAVNLYRSMRELDALGLKAILSKLLPETGIGYAINDRLRKASCNRDDFEY